MILGKEAMPLRVLKNKKAEMIGGSDRTDEDKSTNGVSDQGYAQGDADTAVMPAGQVASLIKEIKGISEVFPDMIQEAKAISSQLHTFFKEED
jgi:enoyl-[acyl-carrier protein] reductase II